MSKKINYNKLDSETKSQTLARSAREKSLGIKDNVDDIDIPDIPKDKLKMILTKIDMSSHENINSLLFAKNNAVNPNGTIFHSCTINAIFKNKQKSLLLHS
uniref:Uncharacterized protein n=1 Tax=Mimivirus LCMiAC02 TaxID=2506609 RepID=A0A481Z0N5_9VIRU|nr:MAG: hypothetical protein LCMiAC02_01210 [Mimivirus LCMiAC02]